MTNDSRPAISREEERQLVVRLKSGDMAALDTLWRAYADVVFATVVFPTIPVRDQAEEVLQNTFVKAYERIGGYKFDPSRGILPWLKTIARNLATDIYRKSQRTERFCTGYGNHLETAGTGPSRPDEAVIEGQEAVAMRERVQAVFDSGKLNERYLSALRMRLWEELDREVCAQKLGIKLGTFDVLFHRAIKRFKTVYTEMYEDS
jgi:RNA polymerase sigma factor (sigma-70 family)